MTTLKYYGSLALLLPIAIVKGVWTGLAQIPGYVSAQVSSTLSTARELRKNEETGTTQRERRLSALRGNRNN